MRMVQKAAAALTAALLCATLLAGCMAPSSSSSAAASSAPAASASSAPADSASSGGASDSASSAAASGAASGSLTAYSPDDVKKLLDEAAGYESDTAGGSLQSAIVAADLVRYAAEHDTPATVTDDAKAWADGLEDGKKETVRLNWPNIHKAAKDIIADPAGQGDLLNSAGVTDDFTKKDLSRAGDFIDALDAHIGKL